MTIQELVHIMENKLILLKTNLASHEINGDLDLYEKVKLEITETELTIEKLLNV